jgi:hypothetical protein
MHEYLLRRSICRPEPLGGVPILSPGGAVLVRHLPSIRLRNNYVGMRELRGSAPVAQQENTPQGFVEGLNNKIRVTQRRAYGYRDEAYLRLKILTAFLPRK